MYVRAEDVQDPADPNQNIIDRPAHEMKTSSTPVPERMRDVRRAEAEQSASVLEDDTIAIGTAGKKKLARLSHSDE